MAQQFMAQGRVVWGHPGNLVPKKDKNKQPVLDKVTGQPVQQCSFGLAIERNHFYTTILPLLQAEARTAFPNAQPNPNVLGGLVGIPQNFAWKFKDGEGVDNMGKPFNTREGYAGHCVLAISTQGFAPPLYKANPNGGWLQIQPNEVKCGDFIAVSITVKFNGATGNNTPGLYVNPDGVIFLGYGQEIVNGRDPDEMFAGFTPQNLPGMSATPHMPVGAMPAAMAPAAAPGYPPAGAPTAHPGYTPQPQPAYAPPQQPAAAPMAPPATDFVHNAIHGAPAAHPGYPPQPAAAPMAPAAYPAHAPAAAPGYPPAGAPTAPTGYPAPGAMPGIPAGR